MRVVQLFKGHKVLIQGFNAFLPRTHHIDPIVAETGILPPHLMQVATSMGIAVNAQGIPASLPSIAAASAPVVTATATTAGPPPPPPPPTVPYHQSPSHWIAEGSSAPTAPYYPPPGPYPLRTPHDPTAPQLPPRPPHVSAAPPIVTPTPLGSTALPSISTSSIPAVGSPSASGKKSSAQFVRAISYVKKIKHRFANDPEVYKTFLAALHSYHKEQKTIYEVYMEVASLFSSHPDLLEEFVLFLPENEAAAITSRLTQSGITPAAPAPSQVLRSESRISASTESLPKRPAQAPLPPGKTSKRARQAAGMSNRTAEESAFFERVKRFLGDKNVYAEFLKCLNLFCQDIIKIQDLVTLVQRFIGQNEELFGWFKRYIGFKDTPHDDAPIWRLGESAVTENGELNLQACKKTGSYRLYPKSHLLPRSSHRTDIGREVLNDTMVSCPVFNSEDSTFIASKKNQYEEALFRCEDERFEMDLLIEYNLAAIAVFEPLARKIELMSEQEKNAFALGPELGGTSTVIYKKAIKKIYGEKADEVLSGLQKNPAVAVPVVLRRLKQKDEEWRRVQRDWNKVWRDIHIKNYYKALDHQGIEFKVNDRRNISGRALISEIEMIAGERRRATERGEFGATHHLELFSKRSVEIAGDLSKLMVSFIKTSAGLGANDRKAVLRFLNSFLPSFLGLAVASGPAGTADQMVTREKHRTTTDDSSAQSGSESENDASNDEKSESAVVFEDTLNVFRASNPLQNPAGPILLFANNNLYILVRLLQMCMERLEKMRTAAKAANGTPFFTEKRNVVASFLDLQGQAEGAAVQDGDFYETLIALLSQLVCGSIDPGVFEERVRFMFGTAAYPIFTFDKLLQGFVKQIQIVLSDPACEQLIRLFDSWNGRKTSMRLSEYSVRMAVESAVPAKENVYRIEYTPKTERMTIQLVDRLSDAAGSGASAESRWSSYVDDFVKLESNHRYLTPKSRIFLARNRKSPVNMSPKVLMVFYNLECKIAINTYKLFYVENTEDFLFRPTKKRNDGVEKRRSRFLNWMQAGRSTAMMDVDQ